MYGQTDFNAKSDNIYRVTPNKIYSYGNNGNGLLWNDPSILSPNNPPWSSNSKAAFLGSYYMRTPYNSNNDKKIIIDIYNKTKTLIVTTTSPFSFTSSDIHIFNMSFRYFNY